MTLFDEIHSFGREFITDKRTRTTRRKIKIIEAYKILTGEKINHSCSTCFIEALLYIINNTKMATSNYRLKKGYIAQFAMAFKGVKAFSNDEMTDELAAEYLKQNPSRAIYFEIMPGPQSKVIPPGVKIIKPVVTSPKTTIIQPENVLKETVKGLNFEPVDEKAEIKASLDKLKIKYHPALGVVKLRKLLADAPKPPE